MSLRTNIIYMVSAGFLAAAVLTVPDWSVPDVPDTAGHVPGQPGTSGTVSRDIRDTAGTSGTPPWCNYPNASSVAALNTYVDNELAQAHKYSPDVKGDRLTLEAVALAQCAPITK
jgi:hypothetical protein